MESLYPTESLTAHPPNNSPGYRSTAKRAPTKPLIMLPHSESDLTGPVFGHNNIGPNDNDMTRQHEGEPLGERIIVTGREIGRAHV